MHAIREHADILDATSLREELEYILLKDKKDSPFDNFRTLPTLTHYLKPHFILRISEKLTWQQALILACQPLLDYQVINEAFIQDCLEQVKSTDYGGYLGTEACIPHTTIEHGVLNDGISLLISTQPIEFPNGRQIHFIFPLSFYDLTKHLKAVNQLAVICKDQKLLLNIKKAADTKTVYQLLRQSS
jgi:mannitol/fructose-specific phosphotransferase system IIA component (Ntr-type)